MSEVIVVQRTRIKGNFKTCICDKCYAFKGFRLDFGGYVFDKTLGQFKPSMICKCGHRWVPTNKGDEGVRVLETKEKS